MSQQLIQIRKLLTFAEICPGWIKALPIFLNQGIEESGIVGDLNMGSHKYCIVGEAHGFNMNYLYEGDPNYCEDCRGFSYDFCFVS